VNEEHDINCFERAFEKKGKKYLFSDGDQGSGRIKRQRRNKGEFFSIEIAFEQNLFHVNVVIIS